MSNTHLLENRFGWNGILAEPAEIWKKNLNLNRPSALITDKAVWSKSGLKLMFNQTVNAEFSTLAKMTFRDYHAERRKEGTEYSVQTISLDDLLDDFGAPQEIDYLSIDTEGSELKILESFDFNKRIIRVITCEHNYGRNRNKIHKLLLGNGYSRMFSDISHFDDWYVLD